MFSFRTTSIFQQEDNLLKNGNLAIVCNQVAWHPDNKEYLFETFARQGNLKKVFTPEHSFYGQILPERYDVSIIEVIDTIDIDDLDGIDALIIELQDVGARYCYVTKLLLNLFVLLKDSNSNFSVYIIDRLNPSGRQVEGTMGLLGIPHRHGLTIGELANLFHSELNAKFPLHIISANAESVNKEFMPWSIPPFNDFAGLFTSQFYSGTCLYKGTNLSYGHGTTRPFESFGAPWLETLVDYPEKHNWQQGWNSPESPLADKSLYIRWHRFVPAFGLYKDEICFGFNFLFIPGSEYHALNHTLTSLRFIYENCPQAKFDSLEEMVDDQMLMSYIFGEIDNEMLHEYIKSDEQKWLRKAKKYILYDEMPFRIK